MLKLVLSVVADPSLKQVVERQLRALAFDVVLVSDAESAIHILQTRKPHLLCVDLRLPRDSGYEVCESQ
jgi:DNA-binding response OmpR family regulator